MPTTAAISLAASAARTASGTGAAVDLGNKTTARLDLAVSAASGTSPTLVVAVETSKDQATWRQVGAFASVAAAGATEKLFAGCDRYVRAKWTIGGTDPSFTFSVAGDAVLVYATPGDFARFGLPAPALASVSDDAKARAFMSATDHLAAEFASGGYTLPLVSWGDDLRQRTCDIAAYNLLSLRGFNPEAGADALVVKRYDDAVAWGRRIAAEALSPPGIVDSTPDEYDGGAFAVSRPKRGW